MELASDIKVEKAMAYLSDTDESCAGLKADVARTEWMAKVTEALHYKLAEGSIEDRKQHVKTVKEVQDAWEKHFKAITDYEVVRARRERACLVIEIYRTVSANRRKG